MVILPVVVLAPIAYVELVTPSKAKFPVPTFIATPVAPVTLPIVIVLAISCLPDIDGKSGKRKTAEAPVWLPIVIV